MLSITMQIIMVWAIRWHGNKTNQKDVLFFSIFFKCIIKQLLDSFFVIVKIIEVSVRVIMIKGPHLDSKNFAYHKSFIQNNCLLVSLKGRLPVNMVDLYYVRF